MADAFLCLFAVGFVLASIRAKTGNIAACIGLHAGWVWVILFTRELTQNPSATRSLSFLLSQFDGFIGWLVLVWTIVLGVSTLTAFADAGAPSSKRPTRPWHTAENSGPESSPPGLWSTPSSAGDQPVHRTDKRRADLRRTAAYRDLLRLH